MVHVPNPFPSRLPNSTFSSLTLLFATYVRPVLLPVPLNPVRAADSGLATPFVFLKWRRNCPRRCTFSPAHGTGTNLIKLIGITGWLGGWLARGFVAVVSDRALLSSVVLPVVSSPS